MAASTVTRESMTNGVTVWNVARVGSALYDRIDSLIGSNITFGGTVSAEGLGVHNFSVGATGVNVLAVRNTSAGTGNAAEVRIGNDVSASALTLTAHSSTALFGGPYGVIDETGDGLFIRAVGASTDGIQFATGASATVRLTINGSGVITPGTDARMLCGVLAFNSASDAGVTSGSAIDFDTEVYDHGGHFAADTFSAPRTGTYHVEAGVSALNLSGGAIDMGAIILPSAAGHGLGFILGYESAVPNNGLRHWSGGAMLNLSAGDTVQVQYFGTGAATIVGDLTTGYRHTYFSARIVL